MITKKEICPKCGLLMIIDEWGGWRWTCMNCEYVGDMATSEEIDDQIEWVYNRAKKMDEERTKRKNKDIKRDPR